MTSFKTLTLVLCMAIVPSFFVQAAPIPPLSAVEVAQIAQKHLEDIGMQNEVFVASVSYKGLIGAPYWSVSWSKLFPSSTKGVKETGLKVQMDGTYLRTVRKK